MARHSFYLKTAALLAPLALFFIVTGIARADWFGDAEIGAAYETNVNRAISRQDRKSDFTLIPAVSFGQYALLGDAISLAVSVDLKYSGFSRFNGLDNFESGLAASVKYKAGLGSYAPWVKVFGSGAHLDFREDFRDEDLIRAGLLLGRRIDERLFAELGYAYESGKARDPRFDTRNGVFSAKADYLLTGSVQMWIGYSLGNGNYVVNLPFAGAAPTIRRAVRVDTFQEPMQAFQLHATARILSLGARKTFTNHWSADIGADFVEIYGNGRHYPDSLYKAGAAYSY